MEETKKKEKKGSFIKKLKSLLALVLVVVVSVLGTLAYLQNKTDPVQNTFTGSDDIDLKVIEPNWEENPGWEDQDDDGDIDNDDKVDDEFVDKVDPDDKYNTNTTKEGENLAKSYTPGLVIPKDPQLENTTGKDYSEWVAIRVDYYIDKTPTKYADFAKNSTNTIDKEVIEEIDFNLGVDEITRTGDDEDGGYWIKIDPTDADATYELYVYSVPLANGKVTEPLFEQIQINSKIKKRTYITCEDNPDTDGINEEETAVKYPSVNIFITGGAIKVEAIHTDELNLTSLEIQGGGLPTTEQAKANTEINAIKGALKEILEKEDVDDTFVSSCSWPTGCIGEK